MQNINKILSELKHTNLGATYDGDVAKVYWEENGEYWSNTGHQTFSDENATVGTIEWKETPTPHLDEEEAKQAIV